MNEIAGPDELVTMIQGVRRWTCEVVESRMILAIRASLLTNSNYSA